MAKPRQPCYACTHSIFTHEWDFDGLKCTANKTNTRGRKCDCFVACCTWLEKSYTPWLPGKEWTYKIYHGPGPRDFLFAYDSYVVGRLASAQLKRARLYDDTLSEARDTGAHTNEHCPSCDRNISVDEWFCYCSLCPDCFLKSDADADNWIGEGKPG